MKYVFMAAHDGEYGVKRMCRVLDVKRSGYYAWRKRKPSTREQANQALLGLIEAEHAKSRKTYGSPRLHVALRRQGVRCGHNRVARLMRMHGIVARKHRRYYPRTTQRQGGVIPAPNRLNQWIYLREESGDDRADVFAVRSVTDAESAASPTEAALDGPLFNASCAAIHPTVIDTSVTTVTAGPGLTYRAVDRLLDTLATAPNWTGQRIARPPGADVGFLTTLSALMATAEPSQAALARPMRRYIYNNVLYDLTMLRTEAAESGKVGTARFPVLWRSDFAVRNRTTGHVTRFAATYVPNPHGVTRPVQIIYQPNWWLKVELRLDDSVEAPPDPGRDAATLRRIHNICAVSAE